MSGQIEVSGLEFACIIGVLPHERKEPQKLILDFQIRTDFASAYQSDSISDTLDYSEISDLLTKYCQNSSFQLLEKLVVSCSHLVLNKYPNAQSIFIRARKPEALQAARYTGASYTAQRNTSS